MAWLTRAGPRCPRSLPHHRDPTGRWAAESGHPESQAALTPERAIQPGTDTCCPGLAESVKVAPFMANWKRVRRLGKRLLLGAGGLAIAAPLTACGASQQGVLSAEAFHHPSYPYAIHYVDPSLPGLKAIVGDSWRIKNFYQRGGEWRPKPGYTVKLDWDRYDDGRVDERLVVPSHEFLFEHVRDDGRLWLQVRPISTHIGDKQLKTLARRYIEGIAGSGTVFVQFKDVAVARENTLATRTLGGMTCEVAGREAFMATFEIADVDQIKLSESARWKRASIVLIRTGFSHELRATEYVDGEVRALTMPTLMIAGYENSPEDFDGSLNDFEALLTRLAIGSDGAAVGRPTGTSCRANSTQETTPVAPAAPTAPVAPSAPDPVDDAAPTTPADLEVL